MLEPEAVTAATAAVVAVTAGLGVGLAAVVVVAMVVVVSSKRIIIFTAAILSYFLSTVVAISSTTSTTASWLFCCMPLPPYEGGCDHKYGRGDVVTVIICTISVRAHCLSSVKWLSRSCTLGPEPRAVQTIAA